MSRDYKITVEDLETLIRETLANCEFSPESVERHVTAQKNYGWLRPNTPSDILALAEIHYTLPPAGGFGPLIPPPPKMTHSKIGHVRRF